MMLSALRKTDLSSAIATQVWVENSYTPLSILINELSSTINPRLSTIADLVSAETIRLDEISSNLSNYLLSDSLSNYYTKSETDERIAQGGGGSGVSVDLSNYTEISTTLLLSCEIIESLSDIVNPKLNTIADKVSAETNRLDTLSGSLSNYTSISAFNSLNDGLSDYTKISAHNVLESRVISTENLIGDILSILQEINDTEGE